MRARKRPAETMSQPAALRNELRPAHPAVPKPHERPLRPADRDDSSETVAATLSRRVPQSTRPARRTHPRIQLRRLNRLCAPHRRGANLSACLYPESGEPRSFGSGELGLDQLRRQKVLVRVRPCGRARQAPGPLDDACTVELDEGGDAADVSNDPAACDLRRVGNHRVEVLASDPVGCTYSILPANRRGSVRG